MKTIRKIDYVLSALLLLIINFAAAHPIAFTNLNVIDMRDEVAILGGDTVHVSPPTGERETDRASILAALEEVKPGGTIQFGPGTYLVGEMIPVSIPQVTLLGHPEGSILRGCEAAAYEEMMRHLSRATDWNERWAAMSSCGLLEFTGGHATVRNLTFEQTDRGLGLGCCLAEPAFRPSDGGYVIENNTFRNSRNGIRASLASADTTVIRENQFINVYHAVSAAASHFHVVDNDISVPEPEHVPAIGYPGFAIHLEPVPPGPGGTVSSAINVCEQNLIAGNRIEGHPDGIILSARPGTKCRYNVIRDNTIAVHRVQLDPSRPYAGPARIISENDSTVVGVPLALINDPVSWVGDDSAPPGILEGNLIEGNQVMGAEGLGIVVYRASRNRVVNNTIIEVTVRDPYPGNTIRPSSREGWDEANGSGIWLSPGSDGNEIADNSFEDIASYAVFIEGDSNRVKLKSNDNKVRDLGSGNQLNISNESKKLKNIRTRTTLKDSIVTITQNLANAWIRLDPEEYLSYFSNDLIFYFQGDRFSRTDFEIIVRESMNALRESTFEVHEPEVKMLDSDAAVITFRLNETMVDKSENTTFINGMLTLVYERLNDKWQIVRAHESLSGNGDPQE